MSAKDDTTSQWARDKLAQLTRDEKIALTAGMDSWRTFAIPEKGIPYIKLTDGPNGARGGGGFKDSTPSTLFPAPACLGATFDIDLAKKEGHYIGLDANEKKCHVVLGPTVNMMRDPRAGRYFEGYSEDSHLSGQLGAFWIEGAQESVGGMAATMKHLVCNEAETDRRFSSSDLSQEALREIYLEPFREIMASLKRRGVSSHYNHQPACVMVAYNCINGVSASENDETVNKILREEWGFHGLVTSDWFSLHAPGLAVTDLEMPGPALHRKLPDLLDKVDFEKPENRAALDRCALKVLDLVHAVAPLGYSESPEKEVEKSIDVNKVGPTIRQIAAEGAVLLKNQDDILPLSPRKGLKIACIGMPWTKAVQSGGGSADLTPQKVVEPLAALKEALKEQDVDITHHYGCDINNFLPIASAKTKLTFYSGRTPGQGDKIGEQDIEGGRIGLWHPKPEGTPANDWHLRATLQLAPCERGGKHRLGFTCLGNMSIKVKRDAEHSPWHYEGETNIFEYSMNPARVWKAYDIEFEMGEALELTLDYVPVVLDDTVKDSLAGAFEVGFALEKDEDKDIEEAARIAGEADIALVLTALGKDWESEGFDRPDMLLPRRQNQLVTSVAKAQSKTAVLNQTGSPIEMPWYSLVQGVVQVWYGGQEGGTALADILIARGDAPASGRLPSTWPKCIQDHYSGKSEETFPGVAGDGGPHVDYREGRLMGYRWYNTQKDAAEPAHYFGSGIGGYTTFDTTLKGIEGENTLSGPRAELRIQISTQNTGQRSGKEVAQIFLRRRNREQSSAGTNPGAVEPLQKFVGFGILRAKAGERATTTIKIYQDAFSFWDEKQKCWLVQEGEYDIVLARSASLKDDIAKHTVRIKNSWTWTGIGV